MTQRNFCVESESQIRMIDFLTVHHDLAGWEIIKAAVSFTRDYPGHCSLSWESDFSAADEERWREFREARLFGI